MKKPNKELLDDLLLDGAPPDFTATLMANTLRSARRRQQVQRVSTAICVLALAGIASFSFWNRRGRMVQPEPARQTEAMAEHVELPRSIEVVVTGAGSVTEFSTSTLDIALVTTSELLANNQEFNSQGKNGLRQTDGAPKRRVMQTAALARHLQCAVPRVHQQPVKRDQARKRLGEEKAN